MVVDNDWLKVEKGDKASCKKKPTNENVGRRTRRREGGSVSFVVLATTFFVGGETMNEFASLLLICQTKKTSAFSHINFFLYISFKTVFSLQQFYNILTHI